MHYTNDADEFRKTVTSLAQEGERAVLLDNLTGVLDNGVFDMALTSSSWKARLLGGNTNFEGPLNLTWYGTGNNAVLGGDLARRVCHIRMEHTDEHPELKSDFRHRQLLPYVLECRGKLLAAALTILRGWHSAGRPTHDLSRWGSYESWSGIVRETIVFAGLADPGLTREELRSNSDRDSASMGVVLAGMRRLDGSGRGTTAAELVQRCQADRVANSDLVEALEELCDRLDGHSVGGLFKKFQRRNFGGWMLDKVGADRSKTNRWAVLPVGPEPASP